MVKKFLNKFKKRKILVIIGGSKSKLTEFEEAARTLRLDASFASFSELQFESGDKYSLKIGEQDLKEFSVIYIRMVGKRLEEASLLVNYAKAHGITLIDRVYSSAHFLPSTISKGVEMAALIDNKIPLPKTFLGSVEAIVNKGPQLFGFPFVIKSTSGRKAREAWAPKSEEDLAQLKLDLIKLEKEGKKFFAQEFIYATQRERAFVVGGRVLAMITRPTKWRKRIRDEEGVKAAVSPIPTDLANLALEAAKAVKLDIAGVDLMKDEKSGKVFVIEVNAAPAWELIKKDTGMKVEEQILKYIISK